MASLSTHTPRPTHSVLTAALLALLFILTACGGEKPSLDEDAARLDDPEVSAAATSVADSAAESTSTDGGTDAATDDGNQLVPNEDDESDSGIPFDPSTGRPAPNLEPTTPGPDAILQGTGVTDDTIRIGYVGDDSATLRAHQAYWNAVNDAGGIAGRTINMITSPPPGAPEEYERLLEGWDSSGDAPLILGGVADAVGLARIADDLIATDLLAIPGSGWSGWVAPDRSRNILEVQASDCAQAINTFSYLAEREGDTVAIVSAPGQPYADSVAGALIAADAEGMELLDGGVDLLAAEANPDDVAALITRLVEERVDGVWLAADPVATEAFIEAAVAGGYREHFGALKHAVSPDAITGPMSEVYDDRFLVGTNHAVWGSNGESAMSEMIAAIAATHPDGAVADGYELGWVQATVVHQLLENAAEQGTLTRRGVVDQVLDTRVDFGGLAPIQVWSGDPDATAMKASYSYEINGDAFVAAAAVTDPEAAVLFRVRKTAVVSDAAAQWSPEACSPLNP